MVFTERNFCSETHIDRLSKKSSALEKSSFISNFSNFQFDYNFKESFWSTQNMVLIYIHGEHKIISQPIFL